MQALKLDAVSGWRWVVTGWRLFRKQPFSFASLLFFSWLTLIGASAAIGLVAQVIAAVLPFVSADAVAAVGGLLVAVLTPALTVGFQQGCRVPASGLPVHPLVLFAPFRAGRQTLSRLFMLGAVQMLALIAIVFATSGGSAFRAEAPPAARPAISGPASPPAGTGERPAGKSTASATTATPTEAEQEELVRGAMQRLKQGFAYLPVALLMWYAPLLVAWHGLPAGKALFFSVVAVWRNRGAFAVYGLAWLAIWVVLSMAIGVVTAVIGVSSVAAIIAIPLVMLLLTCMYCSVYATYSTVFVDPATPTAVVDASTTV